MNFIREGLDLEDRVGILKGGIVDKLVESFLPGLKKLFLVLDQCKISSKQSAKITQLLPVKKIGND